MLQVARLASSLLDDATGSIQTFLAEQFNDDGGARDRALRHLGTFEIIETMEVLIRNWVVRGRSVRPDHRMIGHTGFITTARKCEPRPGRQDDDESEESGSRDG